MNFLSSFAKTACFGFVLFGVFFLQAQVFETTDPRVSELLKRYQDQKRQENAIDVFRIQVFSGERGQANAMVAKMKERFPKELTNLIYDQPNFKVKLGAFRTALDAEKFIQNHAVGSKGYVLKETMDFDKYLEFYVSEEASSSASSSEVNPDAVGTDW